MSESATAPLPQRDIRSAAKEFKRDRDASEKWSKGSRPLPGVRVDFDSMGSRPLAGVRVDYNWSPEKAGILGDDQTKIEYKPRPVKPWTNPVHKSHANKTPKPTNHYDNTGTASNRMVRKVDALVDANEHTSSPLSRSLLELLPQHANNPAASIQTAIRDLDSGVLYSFDNAGTSPGVKGRAVGLDSLVEIAEQKWVLEQTEKMVKGEYEVLDAEGETTVLSKKKKGSPKQKAAKKMPAVATHVGVEDDDGFELI